MSSAWLADVADLRHSKVLGIPVLLPSQTYRVGRVMIARREGPALGPATVQQLEPDLDCSATAIGLATGEPRVVVALASYGDAVRSHPDERLRYAIELWRTGPDP
jgi:hypothetical protein